MAIDLETKELRRLLKATKADLKALSRSCFIFLRKLDEVMKTKDSEYRGRQIANLANYLELANDKVRYGSLGIDFRKDDKDKEWQAIKGLLQQ